MFFEVAFLVDAVRGIVGIPPTNVGQYNTMVGNVALSFAGVLVASNLILAMPWPRGEICVACVNTGVS